MKKLLPLLLIVFSNNLLAQLGDNNINKTVKLKELEVPNSPAFILADITPSIVESPVTPKKFILGIAQSFQQSENAFPQNYSAEFIPYWWLNPATRNIYSFLGLKTSDQNGENQILKENAFSGLKFTSLSLAFLNKDLIPDTINVSQKLFSIGIRTTLIKVHPRKYYDGLSKKIQEWHETALMELETSPIQGILTRENDTAKRRKIIEQYLLTPSNTQKIVEEINDLILQKPIFSWDVAAAHITYGIGDSIWKTGRSGIWTNLSSYLPLALESEGNISQNYLNLNFSVRFLSDNYFKNDKGAISKSGIIDIGGKIALEFNSLSIGFEYFKRTGKDVMDDLKRSVGVINYQISDNLYINGAFGKNFTVSDKLVALLGIKWGLGKETVKIPDSQ